MRGSVVQPRPRPRSGATPGRSRSRARRTSARRSESVRLRSCGVAPVPPPRGECAAPSMPPERSVPDEKLFGFADLHCHPMAHLGFGGAVFSGAPDGKPEEALGRCDRTKTTANHGCWGLGLQSRLEPLRGLRRRALGSRLLRLPDLQGLATARHGRASADVRFLGAPRVRRRAAPDVRGGREQRAAGQGVRRQQAR